MAYVTIKFGGNVESIEVKEGVTVLEAALESGLKPPFACKAGKCRKCQAKVISGELDQDDLGVLPEPDFEAGEVLTCQAIVKSETAVVHFHS
ncbi:MAG: 2Fe-2S iron-sulfur cluster binding domain-containing protein [Bacteriovoracaceae bacterium]|jgi:ferredoxin|nr:2Fe-2S iron-sulfur cluster binding domain-containing protein [Bacteriovoracaceae bacterium]